MIAAVYYVQGFWLQVEWFRRGINQLEVGVRKDLKAKLMQDALAFWNGLQVPSPTGKNVSVVNNVRVLTDYRSRWFHHMEELGKKL